MRRTIAAVVSGLALLAGVGCKNFSYVQQDAMGGVIAVKASEKDAALAQLQQEQGAIEVVMTQPMSKPSGGLFDPKNPVGPSERMTATSGFGSFLAGRDEDKVQIQYRKKGATPPGLPPADDRGGVVPAGGIQSKSQYDRTPGGGAATVVPIGGTSNTTLPTPNLSGTAGGVR
jgi:hypothetical protein